MPSGTWGFRKDFPCSFVFGEVPYARDVVLSSPSIMLLFFLFPSGVQVVAIFAGISCLILMTCPSHFHHAYYRSLLTFTLPLRQTIEYFLPLSSSISYTHLFYRNIESFFYTILCPFLFRFFVSFSVQPFQGSKR
jgi:hypothetical protein